MNKSVELLETFIISHNYKYREFLIAYLIHSEPVDSITRKYGIALSVFRNITKSTMEAFKKRHPEHADVFDGQTKPKEEMTEVSVPKQASTSLDKNLNIGSFSESILGAINGLISGDISVDQAKNSLKKAKTVIELSELGIRAMKISKEFENLSQNS